MYLNYCCVCGFASELLLLVAVRSQLLRYKINNTCEALPLPLPTLSRPDEPSDNRRRRSCRAFWRTSGMLRYDADRPADPALPGPAEVPPPSHVIRPLLSLRSSPFDAGGFWEVLRSMLDRFSPLWGAVARASSLSAMAHRLFAYYAT